MMKFYQGKQPGRVWDPIKNKVVIQFTAGVFETEDEALISLLTRAGYRSEGSTEPGKPVPRMVRKKK